jgi:sulfatase maturation enzyme AslB (radical SAM superfamily)
MAKLLMNTFANFYKGYKMACIDKIYSVSALVGNGSCNANCSFCAGKYLRVQARLEDQRYYKNLEAAIKLSARYGGWSLSLTGSGEPTCDPDSLTKALEVYSKCAKEGAYFPNVNLFTNGILFANNEFCEKYLEYWKSLGLGNIVVSIHDVTEDGQAIAYNVNEYPKFWKIVNNIKKHGLGLRATLLLRKDGIDDSKKYSDAVYRLINYGFENITSWPVGEPDGSRNKYTPSRLKLLGIRYWLYRNAKLCHGHVWGGGVYDYNGNILRYTDYVTKHNPKKDFVRQLVVFQDGTVSYSWIQQGALCMK